MLSKKAFSVWLACAGLALAATPVAAQVQLTMSGGRVTLSVKNATPSQILAEWAKVGQTKIVNPERVTGGPMTLELSNVTELEAIEVVLRSAGGYVIAPRRTELQNASRFDRILILPQSVATAGASRVVTAPPAQGRPVFGPQQVAPTPPVVGFPSQAQSPPEDSNDAAERPAAVNTVVPNARPVFGTFPQAPAQRTAPPPSQTPTYSVTAPGGVSVPGMVVPAPQQDGQPGSAQQPER